MKITYFNIRITEIYNFSIFFPKDIRPGRHVFRISTAQRSFAVLAETSGEKKDWLKDFKEFVIDPVLALSPLKIKSKDVKMEGKIKQAASVSESGATNTSTTHFAPIWQADSEVSRCNACDKWFSFLRRWEKSHIMIQKYSPKIFTSQMRRT